MKPYMVFADEPPVGYNPDNELLMSLTKADVIDAYGDWGDGLFDGDDPPDHWDELSSRQQEQIFRAVLDLDVDLWGVFDGVLR